MQPGIAGSGLLASFWRVAVLGFVVLALANLALIAYAQFTFSVLHPEFAARAWPTFSRALSVGDLVSYGWLAGAGGAGLFAGAAAVAAMRFNQARQVPARRRLLLALAAASAVAALLGIVHYFLVTVSLRVNGPVHMALSYVYFFGMTLLILVDTVCAYTLARAARDQPTLMLTHMQRRAGWAVLAGGVAFLVTFALKDVAANPWRSETQKVFVCAEIAWVVLTHLYAGGMVAHANDMEG